MLESQEELSRFFEERLSPEEAGDLYFHAVSQKAVLDRLPRFVIQVTPITTFHNAYAQFLMTVERGIECVLAKADRWKRFLVWRALTDRDVLLAKEDKYYRGRILRSLKKAPPPEKWEYVFTLVEKREW